jgi:hypothetical protein
VRDRPPGAPPRPVPQREVDRRERLRKVALGRARREQLGVPGARVGAAQQLAVGIQRRGDRAERDAVVRLERRGLADPEVVA